MFLKQTLVKKLIKQAKRSDCLRCGFNGDWFVLTCAGSWCFNIHRSDMQNWFKAAIVEAVGFIPESMTSCDRLGNTNYSIDYIGDDLAGNHTQSNYKVTPVSYTTKYDIQLRFLQNCESDSFKYIEEDSYKIIELSETGANENAPVGAFFDGRNMIFRNENCRVGIPVVNAEECVSVADALQDTMHF